jgi:hypothetical protein
MVSTDTYHLKNLTSLNKHEMIVKTLFGPGKGDKDESEAVALQKFIIQ